MLELTTYRQRNAVALGYYLSVHTADKQCLSVFSTSDVTWSFLHQALFTWRFHHAGPELRNHVQRVTF